jgi:spore maturation protein SpmA
MRNLSLFLCYQVLSIWMYVRSSNSEVVFQSFIVQSISGFILPFLKRIVHRRMCVWKGLAFVIPMCGHYALEICW